MDPHDDDLIVSPSCCGSETVKMQPVMKPLASYKPAGKRENVKTAVGDTIPTYCVEPDGFSGKSDAAILVVHDIFGWGHANNFQCADALSAISGLPAVMPHFFHRAPAIDTSPFDGKTGVPFHPDHPLGGEPGDVTGGAAVLNFVAKNEGGYDTPKGKVGSDLKSVLRFLREKYGVRRVGLVGYCYGAIPQINGGMDQEAVDLGLSVVIGVHPSLMSLKMAAKQLVPVGLLPGNNDPDFTRFLGVLYQNPNLAKPKDMNAPTIMHWRFDDVPHGWCTSRGDFEDPLVAKRANEAHDMCWRFMRPHLLGLDWINKGKI